MYRVSEKAVLFAPPETIEPAALKQIENTASMPFVFKHVAVMPDCHFGKGATVGTVIATKGAIIPAAVGVDIGCGMVAVKTRLARGDITDSAAVRAGIERRIPMSAGNNNRTLSDDRRARVPELSRSPGATTTRSIRTGGCRSARSAAAIISSSWPPTNRARSGPRCTPGRAASATRSAICTSGGRRPSAKAQRHFAARSGPRVPGRRHQRVRRVLRDVRWAQKFARLNRDEMMDRVMIVLSRGIYGEAARVAELEVQRINCHHNFSQVEEHFGERVWVTRKGAIEARRGMWAMIPGSMGTRSYIVTGLEQPDGVPFCSARRRAALLANRGAKAVHDERPRDGDGGIEFRRSPVLLDEIPVGLQGHRRSDGACEGARRDQARAEAVCERQRGLRADLIVRLNGV